MKSLTENADIYDLAVPRATGVERHFKVYFMKSFNENTDSYDLAVPRETGVERYFKRDLK